MVLQNFDLRHRVAFTDIYISEIVFSLICSNSFECCKFYKAAPYIISSLKLPVWKTYKNISGVGSGRRALS